MHIELINFNQQIIKPRLSIWQKFSKRKPLWWVLFFNCKLCKHNNHYKSTRENIIFIYKIPAVDIGNLSCTGNFSQPM